MIRSTGISLPNQLFPRTKLNDGGATVSGVRLPDNLDASKISYNSISKLSVPQNKLGGAQPLLNSAVLMREIRLNPEMINKYLPPIPVPEEEPKDPVEKASEDIKQALDEEKKPSKSKMAMKKAAEEISKKDKVKKKDIVSAFNALRVK